MQFPDVVKAGPASKSIFKIIDRKPPIDCMSEDGEV